MSSSPISPLAPIGEERRNRTMLGAYGWTDVSTTCVVRLDYEEPEGEESGATHRNERRLLRWPENVHDEVLTRLLALNQLRAEEERKMATPKQEKPKAPKTIQPKTTAPGLFGDLE
jgi:hypothetical protein